MLKLKCFEKSSIILFLSIFLIELRLGILSYLWVKYTGVFEKQVLRYNPQTGEVEINKRYQYDDDTSSFTEFLNHNGGGYRSGVLINIAKEKIIIRTPDNIKTFFLNPNIVYGVLLKAPKLGVSIGWGRLQSLERYTQKGLLQKIMYDSKTVIYKTNSEIGLKTFQKIVKPGDLLELYFDKNTEKLTAVIAVMRPSL